MLFFLSSKNNKISCRTKTKQIYLLANKLSTSMNKYLWSNYYVSGSWNVSVKWQTRPLTSRECQTPVCTHMWDEQIKMMGQKRTGWKDKYLWFTKCAYGIWDTQYISDWKTAAHLWHQIWPHVPSVQEAQIKSIAAYWASYNHGQV